MVKSVENGVSVPPFLLKCYEMVDDESTDGLISWSQSQSSSSTDSNSDNSFIIWDVTKFCSQLLPKYFKHSNFASFVRQLNIYGFRKVDTDRWEFANDNFVRGQKHLLKGIVRRKNSQNVVPKTTTQQEEAKSLAPEEDKRLALRKEVDSLTTDKNILMQELIKVRQHQQISQSKLLLLREQVKGMEKNQQQMLSFIVMAMQNPSFWVQFMQPKGNNLIMAETGANAPIEVEDNSELTPSNGVLVKYQPPPHQVSGPICNDLVSDISMEMDFCPDDITEYNQFTTDTTKNASIEVEENNSELPPSNGVLVKYQSLPHQVSGPICNDLASDTDKSMEMDFSPDDITEYNQFTTDTTKNASIEVEEDNSELPPSSNGVLVKYQSPPEKPMDLDFLLDDIKDLFTNIDFSVGPFDEEFLSSQNNDPFVIPDMHDGADMLEMLLSSPVAERGETNESLRSEEELDDGK